MVNTTKVINDLTFCSLHAIRISKKTGILPENTTMLLFHLSIISNIKTINLDSIQKLHACILIRD